MDSKYRRPIELPWAAKEREISEYYAAHEMNSSDLRGEKSDVAAHQTNS
jgi:hypothetical protein